MRGLLSICVVIGATGLLGCETDLGECNMAVANKVVYSASGVPFHEGQALVHQSCANGVCHAASATRDARIGVPHGLNFDLVPLAPTSTAADLSVLRSGIDRIRDEAGEIYDVVDSGEMPPGEIGKRMPLPWRTLDANMKPTVVTAIPSIHDDAGKEVLRNWLACDAPIIAGVTGAPAGAEKLGTIAGAADVIVEPTFASIYDNVLSDSCVNCHNGTLFTNEQALDFSSADTAFATLVGQSTFAGGACDGVGQLVAAGNCENSVLYQKLTGMGANGVALCGAPMPVGATAVSGQALEALCAWIDAGAVK